jgi:hypothetical protein
MKIGQTMVVQLNENYGCFCFWIGFNNKGRIEV